MAIKPHPEAALVPLPMGEGKRVRLMELTAYPERKEAARQLRRTETKAEGVLWQRLRNRALGGFKFRRQFPIGVFVADFCCLEKKLVIEVDGGHHLERQEDDENRTRGMEQLGFQVVRFWNDDVLGQSEKVCRTILQVLSGDRPLPSGEGPARRGEA